MQTINKSLLKNKFAYTWFIYPVAGIILTLLWLWSFPAYHQPSAHQKINAFFATDIKNDSFADKILEKYDREQLREITPSYALPGSALYSQKLSIAIGNSDVLILTKTQFDVYKNKANLSLFFAQVTSYVQEKCQIDETMVYQDYGIMFKTNGESHYLEQYMTFVEDDYILAFSISSQNLGSAIDEDNAPYDNAFTFAHYLIEGV